MSFKRFAFVVHDEQTVRALAATGRSATIHLELETGMGRHGVSVKDLDAFLQLLQQSPKLRLEGVMTHLADADNPTNNRHTQLQVQRFDTAVERIRAAGFNPSIIHIAQSAGSTKVTSMYANCLRVGIGLYGVSPLGKRDRHATKLKSLKPVLTLTSTVTKVLELEAGETVGYGCTYTLERASRIGVLPIGYYEGLPRSLSNNGHVLWKQQLLPIRGRVCMNHTMIDLTDSKTRAGDTVTVISANAASSLSINSISRQHDLFNYSLLTGLNHNIRRHVVH